MTGNSERNRAPRRVFFATAFIIFIAAFSAADSIGFVPYYIDGSTPLTTRVSIPLTTSGSAPRTTGGSLPAGAYGGQTAVSVTLADLPELGNSAGGARLPDGQGSVFGGEASSTLPERIVIAKIDLDLPVQNIETRDIDMLFEKLKNGPIRYVDSARLGEEGNVLIFGHSSRLPVVKNQMYKAFNRIPELARGDIITVAGGGRTYLYSVVSVEKKDTKDPTSVVSLAREGKKLTLVTCDTLTGETARFVLEANFIGSL